MLAHCLPDPQTRVVAVYAEQIRQPQRFLALARDAAEAGKPIVLLMPGRSERARHAAASHTGALAGDPATATALLRREAVAVVDTLDELFDTTAVLLRHPPPSAGGTAFITGSGAMKNIALDLADAIGLELPALTAATAQWLTEKLPSYAVAENPLDYTTIGVRQPGLIGEIVRAIANDPQIGNLVLSIPVGPDMAQRDKALHIVPAIARVTKPAVRVLTGDNGPVEPFFIDAINEHGVTLFRSADRALRALRSDAELDDAIRALGGITHHPVGTCAMGTGPDAVVDPQLRVHGIAGLRVADASVMPTIVGGNTNAATLMIGEKAADLIIDKAPPQASTRH